MNFPMMEKPPDPGCEAADQDSGDAPGLPLAPGLPWTVYCDWERSRDPGSWNVVTNLATEAEAWAEVGRKLDSGLYVHCIERDGRIVYTAETITAQLRQIDALPA